jgi:uncharacterized protein YhbP (UPF0306 family)
MDVGGLIRQYLDQARIMQLATSHNGQPWVVSVHFAFDDELNIYWMSTKERRHSREIYDNPLVAMTIPMRHPDNPLIGFSAEGEAEMVSRIESEGIINNYYDRFNLSEKFRSGYFMGTEKHELFKMKPRLFVLFDELNFPDSPRQEWIPKNN